MTKLYASALIATFLGAHQILGAGGAPAQQRTSVSQPGDTVVVTRFTPSLRAGNKVLYRVSFRYRFPQTTRVFLEDVGELPPEGSLSFLTSTTTLTFRDEGRRIVRRVDLNITSTPEGAGSKMPAPEDFQPEFQSYTRVGELPPHLCDATLNRFFAAGYRPRTEGGLTYYVTAYQALTGISPNKHAEVALQISSPYLVAGQPTWRAYRVQMLVRERGKGSANWAAQVTPQSMTAANALRTQVITHLAQ